MNKDINDQIKLRETDFSLFPYIFVGTGESSCPLSLRDFKYASLSQWHVFKDPRGNSYISDNVKDQYFDEFTSLINTIYSKYLSKAPEYSHFFDEVFQKLFRTVKQEDAQGYLDEDPKIAKHLFVKTHAYKELRDQSAYILTGRKGTGKTTLTEYLPKFHPTKYKEHLPIKMDDFELETIMELMSRPQIMSDSSNVIRKEHLFRIAWEVFIYLHCMEVLIFEHNKRELNQSQEKALPYIDNFIQNTFSHDSKKEPLPKPGVFKWALNRIINEVEKSINDARATNHAIFLFDIDKRIDDENIIEAVFTKDVLYPFSNILKECRRRFLISLDGFDRNFDEYRRIAKRSGRSESQIQEITSLEKDWVRSLLYLCRVIKRKKDRWGLFQLIDFCATVPKDRCIEIMNDERDTVAYVGHIQEIKWSGIELVIMLRKRIEILFQFDCDKNNEAINCLNEALFVTMPKLPRECISNYDSKNYSIPIFLEVLRHTFWRPRDILMYFTAIIASYKYLTKRGIDFDSTVINKKISDTTFDVIEKEFINEFKSTLPNIDKIIGEFKGKKQILSYKEFEKYLSKIEFDFSDSVKKVNDVKEKASFLFEIGFIGLRCPENVKNRFKLPLQDVFYFNDTGKLERMVADNTWKECEIIIHPIFCDYLDLDSSNQEIVLKYDWDYLKKQEAMAFSTNV